MSAFADAVRALVDAANNVDTDADEEDRLLGDAAVEGAMLLERFCDDVHALRVALAPGVITVDPAVGLE